VFCWYPLFKGVSIHEIVIREVVYFQVSSFHSCLSLQGFTEPDDIVTAASLMNSLLLEIFRTISTFFGMVMTSHHFINNLFITHSFVTLDDLLVLP